MNSNVEFEAVVAIGNFNTAAVWNLKEGPAPGFAKSEGVECCCVKEDVVEYGAEDWVKQLPNKPESPGIYFVTGNGYFDEDDGIYNDAVFKPMFVTQ